MAEQDRSNIFVYMGGEQEVPMNVTRVIIDPSVKIIPPMAFYERRNLMSVESRDGVEKIQGRALFNDCTFLRGINLSGVKVVGYAAFSGCTSLTDVEFGDDKLDTIVQ
jgi:hypothetical protein